MKADEAKDLARRLIEMVEEKDIDHHSVTEERAGKQRFVKVEVSIKLS